MLILNGELVFTEIRHIHKGKASEMVSEDIHCQCKLIGFHIGELGKVVVLLRYSVEKYIFDIVEILL